MKINSTILGFIAINCITLIFFGCYNILKTMDMENVDNYYLIWVMVCIFSAIEMRLMLKK